MNKNSIGDGRDVSKISVLQGRGRDGTMSVHDQHWRLLEDRHVLFETSVESLEA